MFEGRSEQQGSTPALVRHSSPSLSCGGSRNRFTSLSRYFLPRPGNMLQSSMDRVPGSKRNIGQPGVPPSAGSVCRSCKLAVSNEMKEMARVLQRAEVVGLGLSLPLYLRWECAIILSTTECMFFRLRGQKSSLLALFCRKTARKKNKMVLIFI